MPDWQIIFEVRVSGRIAKWTRRNQFELDAIQRLLRAEGPAGLGWDPQERAACAAWEDITEAYRATYWVAFEERFYRVTLEVRPGRTVIVRNAETGIHRRRPLGR